jgi:methionine-rich copper-binding protein CopC
VCPRTFGLSKVRGLSSFTKQGYPEVMTRIIAVLASLFLFSTGLIGGALPASAHADLVSTDPVDGSVLESAPELITLSFNSNLLKSMAELAVSNSAGELIPGIVAESVQATASALWPADLPGDTYTIAYRIVSEDGHPVTGSFSFSYPDSVTDPQVTAMETPSPENSAVEPTSTSSGSAGSESKSESGAMLGWVLGFIALALIVVGYFIWRKRSK